MIVGAHVMIQSTNAPADRAFFRDVLKLSSVDAGGGFLLFAVPPSEIAVHEAAKNGAHELYLMCDDIDAFLAAMRRRKIKTEAVTNQGWGRLSGITLPGGGKLSVYQPLHKRPKPARAPAAARKAKKPAPRKAAARKATRSAAKARKR